MSIKHVWAEANFMRRVSPEPNSGCWLWTGAPKGGGYGQLIVVGRLFSAHRYAYELFVGPIPSGLQIDHLCRTPACVNPAHLEPVTGAENVRRGARRVAKFRAKRGADPAYRAKVKAYWQAWDARRKGGV